MPAIMLGVRTEKGVQLFTVDHPEIRNVHQAMHLAKEEIPDAVCVMALVPRVEVVEKEAA